MGMGSVEAVEDPARRLDDLPVTAAPAKLLWPASALRMVGKLADMLDDALHEQTGRCRILQGGELGDRFQVRERRLGPDYLSHLARRFSACSWLSTRPSAIAISPRAMPSRMAMRSCCSW